MKNTSLSAKGLACGLALVAFASLTVGAPILPTINTNNVVLITALGASTNSGFDNTPSIQSGILIAAQGGATNGLVGGTVRIPGPGTYLSGPLTLKNNVNLQIDAGATLMMLPLSIFTNLPSNVSGEVYGSLIYASGLTNLEISGSGTIDGQGADWWPLTNSVFGNRPYMIYFNSSCKQVLVRDVTIQNAPAQNLVFKGSKTGNITVQNITENAPPSVGVFNPSHNTDGIDLVGTNGLVQNCNISVGDDNIALGTSSGPTANILVTNCAFGSGHGVSIGSNTAGGVSNLTVINCTFSDTDNGIRMKADNDRGGVTENCNYSNLGMTNIHYFPIIIYSYYNTYGTPTGIVPTNAAGQPVAPVLAKTPIWRNITISNLTATVGGAGIAGILWGRTELAISNVVMSHVNITAPQTFDVYNAYGVQFLDSQITVTGTNNNTAVTLYNADLTFANSAPGANLTMDGLAGINSLALFNAQVSMTNSDAIGFNPITLGASTLTINNDLTLPGSTVMNFTLGTTPSTVGVAGNLTLNHSTLNIASGEGYGLGDYTLFTYGGSLNSGPALGTTPPGSIYSLTNPSGQIRYVVTYTPPPTLPVLGNISITGNSVLVSGTGGSTYGTYYVLTSTNIALPIGNWTRLTTNQCGVNGNFIFNDQVGTNTPQRYYLIQLP